MVSKRRVYIGRPADPTESGKIEGKERERVEKEKKKKKKKKKKK